MSFPQGAEALFLTLWGSSFASLKVTVAPSPSLLTVYPWFISLLAVSSAVMDASDQSAEAYHRKHVWCVLRLHKNKVCSCCFRSGPFPLWHWHEAAQHQATSGSAWQGQCHNPSGAHIPFPGQGRAWVPPSTSIQKEKGLQSRGIVPWSLLFGKDFILFFFVLFSSVMAIW